MNGKNSRKLAPIFFVAVPDSKSNTRSATAHRTLIIELMSCEYNEDGTTRPVKVGSVHAMVDEDDRVTFTAILEKDGEATQWIRETYDTKKWCVREEGESEPTEIGEIRRD